MSNWVENNPSKSIISYTFVVAAFTWAVSTFVLQDNRINLLRSEVDSQKAIAEQYKSKVDLLQREIDTVRAENSEYRAWLSQAKDAVPIIVPRITELKSKIAELERRTPAAPAESPASASTPTSVEDIRVSRGRAHMDSATGLVIALLSVDVERRARVSVKLPGKAVAEESTVQAGWQWGFSIGGASYALTVMEVNFVTDTITARLTKAVK